MDYIQNTFTKKPTQDCITDAISTYEKYYLKSYGEIKKFKFVEHKIATIEQMRTWNMLNIGWNRLQSTPEKAYPENDRPRGDSDIASINYALNIIDGKIERDGKLSPIIVFEVQGKKILLDGVHRMVASYIRDKPVLVLIIYFFLVYLDDV